MKRAFELNVHRNVQLTNTPTKKVSKNVQFLNSKLLHNYTINKIQYATIEYNTVPQPSTYTKRKWIWI